MEKKLNIAEILKNAPKGTKLWSPICGDCVLDSIDTTDTITNYAISCLTVSDNSLVQFTANGKYTLCYDDGECVLFPSKENRDWATFKVPKEVHKHFEPFQKVLCVIDSNNGRAWFADFYSHYDDSIHGHYVASGYEMNDDEIIPYEGNEELLGKPVKAKKK